MFHHINPLHHPLGNPSQKRRMLLDRCKAALRIAGEPNTHHRQTANNKNTTATEAPQLCRKAESTLASHSFSFPYCIVIVSTSRKRNIAEAVNAKHWQWREEWCSMKVGRVSLAWTESRKECILFAWWWYGDINAKTYYSTIYPLFGTHMTRHSKSRGPKLYSLREEAATM